MPHWTVSNCNVSVETVTAGSVTVADSCTCSLGPHVTWKTKQGHNATTEQWYTQTQLCVFCTWIGMTTVVWPIFTLASWESNLTMNVWDSPQGRFFTFSNSTLKPLKTKWYKLKSLGTEPLVGIGRGSNRSMKRKKSCFKHHNFTGVSNDINEGSIPFRIYQESRFQLLLNCKRRSH